MKTKLLGWTLLFPLMLPIIPSFGQAQETNHVADKSDLVQSGAVLVGEATLDEDELRAQAVLLAMGRTNEATAQFETTKAKAEKGDAQAQCNLGDCYALGCGGGAGGERGIARKCELRSQEQFSLELSRICPRCFGQAQSAQHGR